MGKLRNADSEIGGFVQWLGRKCRNHNPLEELGIKSRDSMPRQYNPKGKGEVFVPADREDQLVYMSNGRCFVMEVREFKPTEIEQEKLIACGY